MSSRCGRRVEHNECRTLNAERKNVERSNEERFRINLFFILPFCILRSAFDVFRTEFPYTLLVPRTLLILVALALSVACREPAPPPPPPPPTVAATVLVYETVVTPENRSFRWQVLTDGTRVRFGDEAESWRLFDAGAKTITFVDETRRTWRSVTFDEALDARRSLLQTPLPEGAPRAQVTEEALGLVDGRDAVKVSVEAGGYRRALVLSTGTLLPAGSLAMKTVTDPLEPDYAGMLRDLLPVLLAKNGTTLSDRNEVTHAGGAMAIETRLVSVRANSLPKSLFEVPAGFRPEGP